MSGSPRKLLPRGERQASILAAAATAFAHAGFAATSMEDVATEAGVTKLIVYRHFDSKEELYRAVLARVEERLRVEFTEGLAQADRRGVTTRALLRVGREDPDALRLLLVHAQREPDFAGYAEGLQARAIDLADRLVGDAPLDPPIRAWVTRTLVSFVFSSVLNWLEVGDPDSDEEFAELSTAALEAMYRSWAGTSP